MSPKLFNIRSRTHCWNAAGIIASGAMMILPGLEGSISPGAFPWILAGFGFVNYILRNVTTQPIDQR